MKHKLIWCLSSLLGWCNSITAQDLIFPPHYFQSPLDTPLYLAGNFGEIRANHLHAGLDLKTNNREGFVVRASAEGYIARIKVSALGYGKAIYINHPNGFTSVYGHLKDFPDSIKQIVHFEHYRNHSFELDYFPIINEMPVRKGEIIGISGNTGGSEGPHLHFEIRETKKDLPVNPLYFGLAVADTVKPEVVQVKAFAIDAQSRINNENKSVFLNVNKTDSISVYGKIGFGVETIDRETNCNNSNGTYSVALYIDDTLYYKQENKHHAFDKTRYVNAHIDYKEKKNKHGNIQRSFMLPNNKLDIYSYVKNGGMLEIYDLKKHYLKYVVEDYFHNTKEYHAVLQGVSMNKIAPIAKNNKPKIYFEWNKENTFNHADFVVSLPKHALYENMYFEAASEKSDTLLSALCLVHNKYTPCHLNYKLSIKNKWVPDSLTDKLLIVNLNDSLHPSSEGGTYENGMVNTKTRVFGKFAVCMDTIAPQVIWKEMNDTIIRFEIRDNLSGIKLFRLLLNGVWILAEFDAKTNTLFHEKDKRFRYQGLLELSVFDNKYNATTFNKNL